MRFSEARLIVFAKAPVAGRVKTRLIPALGEEGALQLHQKMIEYTLQKVCAESLAPVELWSDCLDNEFIQSCAERFPVELHLQQGADLGERMQHAFLDVLQRSQYAVLIGTDCPDLSSKEIEQALTWLQHGEQAVLGPAVDGGYVLIGLQTVYPQLFEKINWGSDSVLAMTRERLYSAATQFKELPVMVDVDLPSDLKHLPAFTV